VVFLLWFLAGLALALHYQLKARGQENVTSAGAAS